MVNVRYFSSGRISTGVTDQSQQDITGMLAAWNAGDADALDRLINVVYPKLRRIARDHLERRARWREPGIRCSGQ